MPWVGASVIRVLRTIRSMYYRFFFVLNRFANQNIDTHKIIWINPMDVTQVRFMDLMKDRGTIRGGDWDIETEVFQEKDTYRGMYERYVEKKEWSDTNFYVKFVAKIKNGTTVWRCNTIPEFDEYLANIDRLFEDIRDNGYKHSGDTTKVDTYNGKQDDLTREYDEVSVSIGRKGAIIFNDGGHRLAIAQILKLESIPALVIVRHKQWMQFRGELTAFAAQSPGGMLYQQAYHPDLVDIPHAYNDERWDFIEKHVTTQDGRVLDIGANFGLLCYHFERVFNFDCVAVEINPQEVYLAKKIRDAMGARFVIQTQSVFDISVDELKQFNVVLALNIFHHFIKREVEHKRLVKLLNELECQEMFFEAHNPSEGQMDNVYRNYEPDEFADFILEHSILTQRERIYESNDGRILYRLFR